MKMKEPDCVRMTREGERQVYEEIKGMTREQELAYWRAGEAILAKEVRAARRKLARQKARSQA